MKKIFYLIIAMTMCAGNAQAFEYEPEEGLTWMGLFGMNISKLQNHPYNAKVGAMMGVRADYVLPHAHGAYITAGLDWTMKGGKYSGEFDIETTVTDPSTGETYLVDRTKEYDATGKYNLHYIEVPIRVGFRYNLSDEFGFYGEFGPYFSVGVGGRHKLTIDGDGPDVRTAEDEGTFKAFKNVENLNKPTFQRWDAGLGFRIGAEYNQHYNLIIGCDWGLTDMYRNDFRDAYYVQEGTRLPKVHNFNFSITAGYRF